MIEYKYKEKDNKFTENGHTMFEVDVLARLQRLADLEEQVKQGQLLPKHVVIPCFFVALVYQNSNATMLRTLVTEASNEEEALGKSIEYFAEEAKGYGLVMKTVTTPNKG